MQNIVDKQDSTAGANGELTANEYNDHKEELQGAVTRSGQTLSGATLLQLAKALFINGVGAQTVIDSGSVDSILLSPLTGGSGLKVPDNYAQLDGAVLSFNKTTANTSTGVTINFGQTGTELGAKSLVRTDGSVVAIGDVKGRCLVQWDNLNDRWILLENGGDTFKYFVGDGEQIIPKFRSNTVVIDTSVADANLLAMPVGLFEGQKVHIITVGSGVGIIPTGNGVYSGGWHITANTGGLHATWVNGAWVAENEVTAKIIVSGFTVSLKAMGNARQSQNSQSFSPNAWLSYTFPVNFITVDYTTIGSVIGGEIGYVSFRNKTLSSVEIRITGAAAAQILSLSFEGNYS